ncbi:MAG: MbtH family NRPS accessory protein [Acetobacteraceae bacterium]
MTQPEPPPQEIFEVVINHEHQYAIWPADKAIPAKWRTVGVRGSKQECLDHVRLVWTDMRPLNVKSRDRPETQ